MDEVEDLPTHDQPLLPFPADCHVAHHRALCMNCLHWIEAGDDFCWENDLEVHATCPM